MSRRGVKTLAAKAVRTDDRARDEVIKRAQTTDSFQNWAAQLGLGTQNMSSASSYGFNPVTRLRVLLEWIHRGSWLGGVAVDLVADDMTRAGIQRKGTLKPAQIEQLDEAHTELATWDRINSTIKWARLYGGAIGVYLIDGQNPETPLRLETVGKGAFRGIMVLDRWMVEPSLENLVTEYGPRLGEPKFYRVTADAPALPRMTIHYSRCFRLDGVELPYWQKLTENLWGISVLERLYDRMVAFDSATTGVAQLTYKAHLRTLAIDGMRGIVSQGGIALENLTKYMHMMRLFQSSEGLTAIDGKDKMSEGGTAQAMSGMAPVLEQLAQQISGALQIPLVRLLGQSPGGLNSDGDSQLRTYYDGILHQQNRKLLVPVTTIDRLQAQSLGIKLPDGYGIAFRSLWQLTPTDRSRVAKETVEAVVQAKDAGIVSPQTAAKELRQSGHETGIFTNITDEEIESAEELPVPPVDELNPGAGVDKGATGELSSGGGPRRVGTGDSASAAVHAVGELKRAHDLDVVIENPRGTLRSGVSGGPNGYRWEAVLPDHYGYVRQTTGADGDQVDCFVGEAPESGAVFVVDQRDLGTLGFDEHKALLGYVEIRDALRQYANAYSDGQGLARVMAVTQMDVPTFKQWLATADLRQPAASWTKPGLRAVK